MRACWFLLLIGWLASVCRAQEELPEVADTKFSIDRGFYEEPFTVHVTTATEGAEIRYSLNGSAPDNLFTSRLYRAEEGIRIESTAVLRVHASKTGYALSNVSDSGAKYIKFKQKPNIAGVIIKRDGAGAHEPQCEVDMQSAANNGVKLAQYLRLEPPYDTASGNHANPRVGYNNNNPGSYAPLNTSGLSVLKFKWENDMFILSTYDRVFPSLAAKLMFAAHHDGNQTPKNKIFFNMQG